MSKSSRTALAAIALSAVVWAAAAWAGGLLDGRAPQSATAPAAPLPRAPVTVPVAAALVRVGPPRSIRIPALEIDQRILPVGLKDDGAMQTPDFGAIGWYRPGPRPGASGPAVVVAHVHGPAGDDVFADLDHLAPGDVVVIRRARGRSVFVVDSVIQVAKERLPYRRIWKDSRRPLLRLITCAGTPSGSGYPDNTIVFAHLRAGTGSVPGGEESPAEK